MLRQAVDNLGLAQHDSEEGMTPTSPGRHSDAHTFGYIDPEDSTRHRVEADVSDILHLLRPSVCICILGGTQFQDPCSEEVTKLLASKISAQHHSRVVFITGGMSGVQETFAKNCIRGSRVYNLLPEGQSSGYGVGTDIVAGADMDERKRIFAEVGDVYVTVEGGPGVAMEARLAFDRGASIVPLVRTGGASSGMFNFPSEALARPTFVQEAWWSLLSSKEEPVAKSVQAAAEIVQCLVRRMMEEPAEAMPPWGMMDGMSANGGALPGVVSAATTSESMTASAWYDAAASVDAQSTFDGRCRLSAGPETRSLTVSIEGAHGLPLTNGHLDVYCTCEVPGRPQMKVRTVA